MENYLINEQTDKNEIINKWISSGLLDSTKEENKKKTAIAFEIIKMYYMYNNLADDNNIKTLIFPVVSRIIRVTSKEYSFLELINEVMNIFNKLNEFVNSFNFEKYKIESSTQEFLDKDAVTVSKFCSEYQYLFS